MESKEDTKKKRGANFSTSERPLLIQLSNKYKNKKTDGTTWKEKENTWTRIEREFNAMVNGQPRNAKQLKFKYESIKKEMKKEHGSYKQYVQGTGGGNHIKSPKPKTEDEKVLFDTIAVAVSGFQSNFDSDALAGVEGIPFEDTIILDEQNIEEDHVIKVDWSRPQAGYLQTDVNPLLKTKKYNVEPSRVTNDIVTNDENDNKTQRSDSSWASRRRPQITKKKCITSENRKSKSKIWH